MGRCTSINPVVTFFIFVTVSIAATILFCRNISLANILFTVALVAAGVLIYSMKTRAFPSNHVMHFTDLNQRIGMVGSVIGFPDFRKDRVEITVSLEQIIIDTTRWNVCGNILVKVQEPHFYPRYRDRLTFFGKLVTPAGERNPGDFNYREFLAANGVYGLVYLRSIGDITNIARDDHRTLMHAVQFVKDKLYFAINDLYDEKTRPLVKGLILGERGEISPEITAAFTRTGIIHILAISGLHITYISLIFFMLFSLLRFSYRARIYAVMLSILGYNLLVGFEPPIVRSSLMGVLFLAGKLMQRPVNVLNIISASALIILLVNPLALFQASFQLSYGAVISIIYFYQRLKFFFEKIPLFRTLTAFKLGDYLAVMILVSLAAQLGTLPIVLYYFQLIPAIALILNVIAIPLSGVIIALGFASLAASFFSASIAQLYAHANIACLNFLITVVEKAEKIKYGSFEAPSITMAWVVIYYLFLWLILNIEKRSFRKVLVFSLLLVLNIGLFQFIRADNRWLEVIFFDVGQGDAALVSFPNGKRLLIDAGPTLQDFDAGRYFLVPYFKREGIRRLSTVVLSHADNDHIGGMPSVLRSVRVERVVDTGLFHNSKICSVYTHVIDSLNIDYCIADVGVRIDVSKEYGVHILHPGKRQREILDRDINNNSVVLKICYGDVSFLFAGDIEREAEQLLVDYGEALHATVLKIAHHGSNTSSTREFLNLVKPEFAVISLGKNNKFNFPSDEVLERLNSMYINILRTDENGAIIFRTDGSRLIRVR
ncbi:MAG: DNA internalization-related competence protein ComEC/Rec2 [Candidatus Zhuqueibacterota bacterium]